MSNVVASAALDISASAMLGYSAAALVFLTFTLKSMTALRTVAIVSNLTFIAYALTAGLQPVLVLHAALLPMNVWRLCQCLRERQERERHKFLLSSGQFILPMLWDKSGRRV